MFNLDYLHVKFTYALDSEISLLVASKYTIEDLLNSILCKEISLFVISHGVFEIV